MNTDIVLSGMGPTGRLHLGHYHGALKNWCALQESQASLFMIADLAALTTHYESRDVIKKNIWEMLVDWLAAGINPEKATIFIQSRVPEHAELAWLLGMMFPVAWLENMPAYQEKITKLSGKNLSTFGFLGDPVMQAADILLYKASAIPVGADQVDHLHLTREIAKRFNRLYSDRAIDILPEPQPYLTSGASLPGIDGDKMSKSYGNAIFMRSTLPEIEERVGRMATARQLAQTPVDPTLCPVFKFHKVYSSSSDCTTISQSCQSGLLSCEDCKQPLVGAINSEQAPIRQRAEKFLQDPDQLVDIVEEGCSKARKVAQETLFEVREVMGLHYQRPNFAEA